MQAVLVNHGLMEETSRSFFSDYDANNDLVDKISNWDVSDVQEWLSDQGLNAYMPLFEKHEIAGRHLLKMVGNEEMLRDMGIVSIKTRKRIMSYLRLYTRRVVMKPQTAKLKRPNLLNAFLQFFTFAWAETSEGKTPQEQKDEIMQANFTIAVVASVLVNITYTWLTLATNKCFCQVEGELCFCSAGFDLLDDPLNLFFVACALSSACFLHATILAVYQVVAVNEMSDEQELRCFFDHMDAHQNLPGRLTSIGLLIMFASILIYAICTVRLGLQHNQEYGGGWAIVFILGVIIIYVFGFAVSRMIQMVYEAKIKSVKDEKRNLMMHKPKTVVENPERQPTALAGQPEEEEHGPSPVAQQTIDDAALAQLHAEERARAKARVKERVSTKRRRQTNPQAPDISTTALDIELQRTALS